MRACIYFCKGNRIRPLVWNVIACLHVCTCFCVRYSVSLCMLPSDQVLHVFRQIQMCWQRKTKLASAREREREAERDKTRERARERGRAGESEILILCIVDG